MNLAINQPFVSDVLDIKIQSATYALGIELFSSVAGVMNSLIEVTRVTNQGEKVLINKMPLLELAEICNQGDAVFQFQSSGSVHRLAFVLPICPDGAYPFTADEYLNVSLFAGTSTAGTTYSINKLDAAILTTKDATLFSVSPVLVTTTQAIDFPVNDAEQLAFNPADFSKIQLTYPGRSVPYDDGDFKFLRMLTDEVTAFNPTSGTASFGLMKLNVVGLAGVVSVQMFPTAANKTYYLVNNK